MPLDHPLPPGFLPAGEPLWRARLRDGRLAVLVVRVLAMDDQNRERIRYLRRELGLTATFDRMPTPRYLELYDLHWSQDGGNVVLIVPMGEEAFRSEQDLLRPDALPTPPQSFRCRSPHAIIDLIAPNGTRIAVVEFAEMDKQIDLVKGVPKIVELGSVTMRLEPDHLIAGSCFTSKPRKLPCAPSVGGASTRRWEYTVHARFDGSRLSAEIQRVSGSLQNKNFAIPIAGLGDNEEIIIAVPWESLKLSADLDNPCTSAELVGRFTLCDRK
jgi:hypothetical protein